MRHSALSPARSVVFTVTCVVVLSTSGCPECRYYNDCPSGQACSSDKVCVDTGTDPGTTTPPPPPPVGDGGTTMGIDARLSTQFPAQWVTADPRDPSLGLYAVYETGGAIDALRAFSLSSGARRAESDLDLVALGDLDDGSATLSPGTPCGADNIYQENNIPSQHGLPETWLMCRQGAGARVYYDNQFAQPGLPMEPASVDGFVMVRIDSTGNQVTDFERRVTFQRGGSTLNIHQLNPTQDGRNNPRTKDTVQVSFNEITQVWQIPSIPSLGDLIVVFDAGADPKVLVPLVRLHGTETWVLATQATQLEKLTLPPETHALVVIGTIDPQGGSDAGIPNVMAIEPSTGFARFFTMNNQATTPTSQFFTQFEPNGSFTGATPDSKTRLLLEPAPGGGAVFYVHPLVPRVWRIPFTPNAENDVTAYTIGGGGLTSTGIVPTGPYTTWLSVPAQVELIQVTLTVGG